RRISTDFFISEAQRVVSCWLMRKDSTQMKQIGLMKQIFVVVEAQGIGHGLDGLDGFPRIFKYTRWHEGLMRKDKKDEIYTFYIGPI
ncbi:hypothetical protein OAT16_03725, partial [Prolixibacteraceae bacterium]|nr:hypothetical protein [Prolixibacteraceae bacterium]